MPRLVSATSAKGFIGLILCFSAIECGSPHAAVAPSIEFTQVPPAAEGSPDKLYPIQGRAKGAAPGQRIVLFARSGVWWVQPVAADPYTKIEPDSTWKSSTHPGTAYAALLVDADYKPAVTLKALPPRGGQVSVVAQVEGLKSDKASPGALDFSGYQWVKRSSPGNAAGTRNLYESDNAWVDAKGALHLRIAKTATGWTSAELSLTRSLGYGSYRFVIRDLAALEPSMVLAITSLDSGAPNQETDIEISRWGESSGQNAQFVVQPYYIPANVVRFLAPGGPLTVSFDWEPGRITFRTARGSKDGERADVAHHTFTSGVPPAGNEILHLHFYVFAPTRTPLQHGGEVVFETFEYLP